MLDVDGGVVARFCAFLTHCFSYRYKFSCEMFFEQCEICAMDEHVGAHSDQPHLLIDIAPEVDSRAAVLRTCSAENHFAGGKEIRMAVLLWNAEAAGKIVGAYKYGIQSRDIQHGV